MERKSFTFCFDEEKGLDPETRTFQGFAAVMGNLDDGGDIIKYGAFKKTLQEMGDRVKIYKYHDFRTPIGKPLDLREVSRSKLPAALREQYPSATGGLYVKGYISETRDGNDVLTLMRDLVVEEMSIGYETLKEEEIDIEGDGKARHLLEIKLFDVSPVPLAMNPAAWIVDVKGLKVEETEDYIHVPVPGESGKHEGHRIRTITISEDEGIQARYCGECKKNISYIFAKKKGWTVPKAVAWVKEHEKGAEPDNLTLALATLQEVRAGLMIPPGEYTEEVQEAIKSLEELLKAAEPPEKALTVEAARARVLKADLDLKELELAKLRTGGK